MTERETIDGFLAACLRALRAGDVAPWQPDLSADWKAVWERADYHGIPYLLNTKSDQLTGWPEALLSRIAEEARLMILWETTHHQTVSDLIGKFQEAGIDSVLLKGTALAYSLHDEPAARRRGDTDLLIKPAQLDRAREILKKSGWYQKDDPHGLYYQEGWLHDAAGFFVHAIDLHWEPSDKPVLQAILPLEDFFAAKTPVPRFGSNAYRPDPTLLLLHATINQKWHALYGYDAEGGRLSSPRRLIWSIDFDLVLRSMNEHDWEKLRDVCERHGIGSLVVEALRGMQQDLHNDLPEETVDWLAALPVDQDLANYLSRQDSLLQFWIDLRRAKNLKVKSWLILMRAFPPRAHLLEKYPSASGWPTALLHGRLLLETAGRAVRRAVS